MGWEEELFETLDDLEQQAEALWVAERSAELADRTRSAYTDVTLASRLMASLGTEVGLEVTGVGLVVGDLSRRGADWSHLRSGDSDWIVLDAALVAAYDVAERSVPELAWSAVSRLSIGAPLRRLAEAGERCVFHGADGRRHDGVPRRVGADFTEVAVGAGAGRVVLVPFAGLAGVQSHH